MTYFLFYRFLFILERWPKKKEEGLFGICNLVNCVRHLAEWKLSLRCCCRMCRRTRHLRLTPIKFHTNIIIIDIIIITLLKSSKTSACLPICLTLWILYQRECFHLIFTWWIFRQLLQSRMWRANEALESLMCILNLLSCVSEDCIKFIVFSIVWLKTYTGYWAFHRL